MTARLNLSPRRAADAVPTGRADVLGRAGLALTAGSVALTFAVAVAGPSVMAPALPGPGGQPPWSVDAHLSGYLSVALAGFSLVAGTIGLVLVLAALRRGWTLSARWLLLAGLIAAAVLTVVPPFGSSDPLSYAAYGRILVTGHNPYLVAPDVLARLGDPVARAVQDWANTPSDYGPLATAGQAFASLLGGTSVRLTVFVLSVLDLAGFASTALLLHRLTAGDPARQRRAALLWTANPLLLQVLVSGEHVDSQAVVFGVAAVAVLRGVRRGEPHGRRGTHLLRFAGAGALVGLGFDVKVTMALVGAGLAVAAVLAPWSADGRVAPGAPSTGAGASFDGAGARVRAAVLAAAGLGAGFLATAAPALLIGGTAYLHQLQRSSAMASFGSPWRAIRGALQLVTGYGAAEDVVKVGASVLLVVLAVLLLAGLPRGADGYGGARFDDARFDGAAARAAFAFALAWLLVWPYLLPWYDALGWALLPLVAASSADWLLLAGTAALAFGYLPARADGMVIPHGLGWLESVVRAGVTPAVLTIVAIAGVTVMRRAVVRLRTDGSR